MIKNCLKQQLKNSDLYLFISISFNLKKTKENTYYLLEELYKHKT
mgnify:CR=1 FL=1